MQSVFYDNREIIIKVRNVGIFITSSVNMIKNYKQLCKS